MKMHRFAVCTEAMMPVLVLVSCGEVLQWLALACLCCLLLFRPAQTIDTKWCCASLTGTKLASQLW